MHFVLQTPSLQHLAGVKIAAALWNHRDIITQIEHLLSTLFSSYASHSILVWTTWKVIEDNVKNNVAVLPLPPLCKNHLLNFVNPLGQQIFFWCFYHSGGSGELIGISFLQPFSWTMHGCVDFAKTAKLLVKDERVDVEKRFEIACINCLEDEARVLFPLVPQVRRQQYFEDKVSGYWIVEHRILILYFTCTLSGDVDQLKRLCQTQKWRGESVNQYLSKVALSAGSRATCEYFFEKLNPEEKEQVLRDFRIRGFRRSPTCGLMYCLSLLSEEQQRHLFRTCVSDILKVVLVWPMQSLFLTAAKCGWSCLSNLGCRVVLHNILEKIDYGCRDFDYNQLFWECWRLCLADYKLHFLNNIRNLQHLYLTKKVEFIKLVFNEAPSRRLKELLEIRYAEIHRVLMDESVISDAALMECKQTAALNSSNDKEDEEKQLRSAQVSRLINLVMESRIKNREV